MTQRDQYASKDTPPERLPVVAEPQPTGDHEEPQTVAGTGTASAEIEVTSAPEGGQPMAEEYLDPGETVAEPTIEHRVYAVWMWAATLAIAELRDGVELSMPVREAGPEPFLPGEAEFERINDVAKRAIAYVVRGES
jgi:hypothetical protein